MQIAISTGEQTGNRWGRGLLMAAAMIFMLAPQRAPAQSFTIDTSVASPLTGLWGNSNESGWGATITQQSYMLFVTMFVYDAAANPAWLLTIILIKAFPLEIMPE